ncbi:hypothetical protein Pan258_35800 [Symmachiella dynata]|nr:hypothetical protein Pan258_35800 [Symmachiella dynata]
MERRIAASCAYGTPIAAQSLPPCGMNLPPSPSRLHAVAVCDAKASAWDLCPTLFLVVGTDPTGEGGFVFDQFFRAEVDRDFPCGCFGAVAAMN